MQPQADPCELRAVVVLVALVNGELEINSNLTLKVQQSQHPSLADSGCGQSYNTCARWSFWLNLQSERQRIGLDN